MKLNRWIVVTASIVAFTAVDAFAQLGSIRAKIVDEDGNPVGDVECVIEVAGGGGRRSKIKSKDNGQFVKGGVRPATYTISCEKEGFRELQLQTKGPEPSAGIVVSAFDQADLGDQVMFKLQAGELSESEHARATELLAEFNLATESGNHEETLAKLFELKEMLPESTEIDFNIAATYDQMGNKDKAIEFYGIAAGKNPVLAYDAYLAVADLHGQAKEWAPAAAAMKQAMDIRATDPVAMFNYAVYAQNSGDAEAAAGAYEKTLEIDANRAMAHYQLGLIMVGKADDEKALEHFEQFLTLEPDHPQAGAAQEVITALKAKQSEP